MDLQTKMQEAVNYHNQLLEVEREKERELQSAHEMRIQALGKVQMLQELIEEETVENKAFDENGHDANSELQLSEQNGSGYNSSE